MRAYRRYAALAQVLSLGHAAVSVEPEVLLLSDPLPLLYQHPTDVTVMSAAAGDERMAYGESSAAAADRQLHARDLQHRLYHCVSSLLGTSECLHPGLEVMCWRLVSVSQVTFSQQLLAATAAAAPRLTPPSRLAA